MKRSGPCLHSAVMIATCGLVASCMQGDVTSDETPLPTIEELRTAAAELEVAHREYVDRLEAELSSTANQPATDLERQLTRSLERDLSEADPKLRDIRCGGNLCKVEIGGVTAADSALVLAALSVAHTCAMPLIEFPEVATEGTVSAYIDCD